MVVSKGCAWGAIARKDGGRSRSTEVGFHGVSGDMKYGCQCQNADWHALVVFRCGLRWW